MVDRDDVDLLANLGPWTTCCVSQSWDGCVMNAVIDEVRKGRIAASHVVLPVLLMKPSVVIEWFHALAAPSCKVTVLTMNESSLRLRHLTSEELEALVVLITSSESKLQGLNVKWKVDENLAVAIAKALCDSRCSITKADIHFDTKDAIITFAQTLQTSPTSTKLKHLSLMYLFCMQAVAVDRLAPVPLGFVELQPDLEVFYLEQYDKHDFEQISCIARAMTLPENKLKALTLLGDTVPGKSAETLVVIADAMKHPNNKVQYLYFGNEEVGEEGAKALASALMHENNKLLRLWLGVNRLVGDGGARALATALEHPICKVTSLDFDNIGLTSVGMRLLLRAVAAPSSRITMLGLTGPIDSVTVNEAVSFIKSPHSVLRSLRLTCTADSVLEPRTCESLARAVRTSSIRQLHLEGYAFAQVRSGLLEINSQWFEVFITLLSVRCVARLGRTSPCRSLPLENLVQSIAHTLGWPVDTLAFNATG